MPQVVTDVLSYATFAYVVGFITILFNTATYGLPVLEFVKPLNLLIGAVPTVLIVGSLAILTQSRWFHGQRLSLIDVIGDILVLRDFVFFYCSLCGMVFLTWGTFKYPHRVGLLHQREIPPTEEEVKFADWIADHRLFILWFIALVVVFWMLILFTTRYPKPKSPRLHVWRLMQFWRRGFWTVGFWRESWTPKVRFWMEDVKERARTVKAWKEAGANRFLRYLLAGVTLAIVFLYIFYVYPLLPQRYGFGRPTVVQLLLDAEMLELVPPDTPAVKVSGSASVPNGEWKLYLSAPVELLFKADKEYVVRCRSGDRERIIEIEAGTVKGIVWRSEH